MLSEYVSSSTSTLAKSLETDVNPIKLHLFKQSISKKICTESFSLYISVYTLLTHRATEALKDHTRILHSIAYQS